MRVAVVDDQGVVRAGIAALIGLEPDIEVVAQASNGSEAVDLAETMGAEIDVMLLDVEMPGVDGLQALPRVREVSPHTRVLMLTTGLGVSSIVTGSCRLCLEGPACRGSGGINSRGEGRQAGG